MGTRHLISAVLDGEFKLAQYGQWDGYPAAQGWSIATFLKSTDLEQFKAKLKSCTWVNAEQLETVENSKDWKREYPHLSRDAGADVLTMINERAPLFLKDSRAFAGESRMCEWAYVIDFDASVLEVYEGFNHEKTPPDSRFPSGAEWLERDGGYEPVRLVKKYSFAEIPTEKQQFIDELCPPESDDE